MQRQKHTVHTTVVWIPNHSYTTFSPCRKTQQHLVFVELNSEMWEWYHIETNTYVIGISRSKPHIHVTHTDYTQQVCVYVCTYVCVVHVFLTRALHDSTMRTHAFTAWLVVASTTGSQISTMCVQCTPNNSATFATMASSEVGQSKTDRGRQRREIETLKERRLNSLKEHRMCKWNSKYSLLAGS